MSEKPESAICVDTTIMRGARRQHLRIDGAPFEWWAVGEQPVLVTVRSPVFGSLSEFTEGEPAELARLLAQRLLTKNYERVRLRKSQPVPPQPEAAPTTNSGGEPHSRERRLLE